MVFSSITFLYIFLPVVLILYYIVPRGCRNIVLLISSLIFYFFGEPVYTLLLIFSSVSDYLHSLYIEKHRGTKRGKTALISSIIINIGMLAVFKYTDFLLASINSIFDLSIPMTGIKLPIGISFFTFQTMSYTIDVYRGNVHAQKNIISLATFVCLFPQLIAGPIVRYTDINEELTSRRSGSEDISYGIRRFIVGLSKKVFIANAMGELCSLILKSQTQTVLNSWMYAIGYTLQIYYDFSGYSDMAIGLGRMFGFHFPENFNYPYISRSVTEFWRRWHMTLGGWFRDYLYIPLGGNRTGRIKWVRNILIVWFLTGLWHGASVNFILWGLMYGILLLLEKLFWGKILEKLPRILQTIYTMFFVIVGFVVFSFDSLKDGFRFLGGMFGVNTVSHEVMKLTDSFSIYYLRSFAMLLFIAVIFATPFLQNIWKKITVYSEKKIALDMIRIIIVCLILGTLLILVTANLVDASYNPFLYFRF